MSIKKGKKQVYKVECKHKFGNTVGNTWNNVLYGNCYLCNKTVKVSPLKPKKSIKKMYKSKDIEKLFKPIKLREFLKEKALEKEQTEQAKAIKELLKRVRVLEDNQREPNSFMSLQFLTCKRCGGEIKGAHYC